MTICTVSLISLPDTAQAQALPDAAAAAKGADGATNGQTGDAAGGITGIVGEAARSGLTVALNRLGLFTTPNVAPKANEGQNWFIVHYRMMRVMGLWVLMPLVLISICHAIFKSSMEMLLKTVLIYLPLSVIGTAVAVDLVQIMINVTDDFSNVFIKAIIQDSDAFFTRVATGLGDTGLPIIFDLLMALLLLLMTVGVYVIMLVREGSIYLATAFLPIGFAMMVWPSTSRFFKRMVEFLFGIIFSKVIMIAAISLAVASLTGSAGAQAQAAGTNGLSANGSEIGVAGVVSGENNGPLPWVGDVSAAIALLIIVIFAPQMTIRLVSNLGVGEMASHAGNAMTRPTGLNNTLFFNRTMGTAANAKKLTAARDATEGSKIEKRRASIQEQKLEAGGVFRNNKGNYEYDNATLNKLNVDSGLWNDLKDMTSSLHNNPNSIYAAKAAAEGYGRDLASIDKTDLGYVIRSKTGESAIVLNITNEHGRVIRHHSSSMLRRQIRDEGELQTATHGYVKGINILAPTRTRLDDNGRPRAQTKWEEDNSRNIAKQTWQARRHFVGHDGGAPPIRTIFRPIAGKAARLDRPLDPHAATYANGRYRP